MKKLKGILVLVLLLALLASPIAVLASDISGARYFGTIIVSNNSTATTNVAVNCTISTSAFIDAGYLNSSANNCAVRSSTGADIPFMPAANATYPWCFWVPDIGANAATTEILYTAESTGGAFRYFPGAGGMGTVDAPEMELGDNFTVEQKCWWDTTYSVNQTAGLKPAGFETLITATGNITSVISANITKINFLEVDDGTQAVQGLEWRGQTYTANVTFWASALAFKMHRTLLPGTVTMQIRETSGNLPTSVVLAYGTTDGDTLTVNAAGEWRCVLLNHNILIESGTVYAVIVDARDGNAGNRVNAHLDTGNSYPDGQGTNSANNGLTWAAQGALDYCFRLFEGLSVTATGVTSGEYIITTSADTTDFWIEKDGVIQDTTALDGASVDNNANDWLFLQNNVIPYMEYQTISVNNTQVQYIDWEYNDTTFSDNSTFGNDATPTFRTGTSDPDVTAVLTSFLPVAEAQAPAYALEDAPAFIETVPDIVSEWDVVPPAGTFPLAGVIAAVASATDTPAQLPLLIIAAFVIIAFSLAVSATMRRYGSGSLIVKSLVITALMGIFIAIGNFGIDFWMLFVFLVIAIALSMGSKQVGWQ